jgi:hypothetical protein
VEVIGYQYEFVHTGMIKWLLDSRNAHVNEETRFNVLKTLNEKVNFEKEDISGIKCIPEYSFGRQKKLDLVVEIELKANTGKRYLVIEMKVDSNPTKEQLKGTYEKFYKKLDESSQAYYLLFLLGSSHVCKFPEDTHGFNVITLDKAIDIFGSLNIDERLFREWIDSLKREKERKLNIVNYLKSAPDLWDPAYWKEHGYRTLFSYFYYLYNELKQNFVEPKEWDIYSGNNNPVMNWEKGWLAKTYLNKEYRLYWEFNYETLYLKVEINEQNVSRDYLLTIKEKVREICRNNATPRWEKTSNRSGTCSSICK